MQHTSLTEHSIADTLTTFHCSLLIRFNHIHACTQDGQEYHICHQAEILTMTQEQFEQATQSALALTPFHRRTPSIDGTTTGKAHQ